MVAAPEELDDRRAVVTLTPREVTRPVHPAGRRSMGIGDEALGRQLGTVEIPADDPGTTDQQLAGDAEWDRLEIAVDDVHGGVGDRRADRDDVEVAVERRHRRPDRRLGRAVHVGHVAAREVAVSSLASGTGNASPPRNRLDVAEGGARVVVRTTAAIDGVHWRWVTSWRRSWAATDRSRGRRAPSSSVSPSPLVGMSGPWRRPRSAGRVAGAAQRVEAGCAEHRGLVDAEVDQAGDLVDAEPAQPLHRGQAALGVPNSPAVGRRSARRRDP